MLIKYGKSDYAIHVFQCVISCQQHLNKKIRPRSDYNKKCTHKKIEIGTEKQLKEHLPCAIQEMKHPP